MTICPSSGRRGHNDNANINMEHECGIIIDTEQVKGKTLKSNPHKIGTTKCDADDIQLFMVSK